MTFSGNRALTVVAVAVAAVVLAACGKKEAPVADVQVIKDHLLHGTVGRIRGRTEEPQKDVCDQRHDDRKNGALSEA